jgi:hypothetical protein
MHDVDFYKSLKEMEELIDYVPPPARVNVSNDEYISLCNHTIVYRNLASKNIFKWIKQVQKQYDGYCVLLLVRQVDYDLHLLWTGTIPREFWMDRRKPKEVEIEKTVYRILSSKTIGQEE